MPSVRVATAVAIALGLAIVFMVASITQRDASELEPPFVMFTTLSPKAAHGRVAIVSQRETDSVRHVTSLSCTRLHYAGGRGLCLTEEPRGRDIAHVAYTFDNQFVRRHRIQLTGVPIRARVAPTGTLGTITVYAEKELPNGERLATETIVVDMATGRLVANLATFDIRDADALPLGPRDFSSTALAGDADTFFATLITPVEHFVVVGSMAKRQLTVLKRGLAAEALSPDGRHLAAKKRMGERGFWQLMIVDTATGLERPLNHGSRSVDDQVEWFDNEHVIYHDATDEGTAIWVLSIDGASRPRLLIPDAFSPAVQP